MPAPLPKPATPPTNPAAQKAAGTTSVPQVPPPTAPKPAMPTPPPAAPKPGAPTPVKPTTPMPTQPPVAPKPVGLPTPPAAPTAAPIMTPPKPPAPVAVPAMPAAPAPSRMNPPAQPVSAPVGPKPPAVPPMPGQPPAAPGSPVPQQPIRIQQPPQTLTALSSMASNRLPAGADVSGKPIIPDTPNKPSTANVTATPQAPQTAADPKFVQPKKSIMRYLPFIGGGILLLLILGFVAFSFLGLGGGTSSVGTSNTGSGSTATGGSGSATGGTSGGTTKPGTTGTGSTASGPKVTIEYWGLWEPTETMAAVIKDYETKNPNISIKYSKQSYQDYRVRLQNALNSENGPDIFRYHASWVPMLRQQLSAIPTSVMSPNDYQTTFYPVAVNQLQSNGQLVGIPLMYDGLALYYNTELFETAVVTPPKTWAELRTIASQLTLKSGSNVTRGGLAMGNSTNVEHFADVIALLILQNGGDLTKPDSAQVRDALLFYTNFINTDQVWSASLPSSTVAFSRGDAAMMIAPSWRAHEVKAMNPDLKFATTPLPQLSETRITWASYWAEGVSGKSSKKEESWKFLKYLSSKEVQQKLYADQAKARSFGELYSRKDLANELAGDPVTSAFMQDAPYAKGWQMSSFTHDDGANDQIIKYYEDAVTALNEGENIEDVQETLTQGVSQVLRQYGISSASTQ